MSENTKEHELALRTLRADPKLQMRLKLYLNDLLNFNKDSDAQVRLESDPAASYYLGSAYFSTEQIQYLLKFPSARSGITFQQCLEGKMTEKVIASGQGRSRDYHVCTSHDLAPCVQSVFNIQKGFQEEKAFREALKAKGSAKKIYEKNTQALGNLRKYHAGIMAVYAAWRIIYHWNSFTLSQMIGCGVVNGIFVWLYRSLSASATATIANGTVEDAGFDLSGEGLVAYMFDVIYIGWFVLITTAFISSKFWWTYIVVPIFAAYTLYKKVAPMLGRGPAMEAPMPGKKQQKQKVKYSRG
ncbi:hypothetical protein PhCBS80983_g00535 [Powellomyces hirtus]|uniref:Transmembrane protein 208 n=1 Tax=Powellomyces hirtus TaxID=109895 RepID=A0A507EFU6_9FUNG|nr:hypothetical protein PhCBS80983_g00535 [Powellomyces hirtus]